MSSSDDAVAVSRRTYQQSRLVVAERDRKQRPVVNLASTTLVELCQTVIVNHLERFPAYAFSVCGEDEFEALIRLRHAKTAPKEGTGGLDGTGRVAPAIGDRFMAEVEEANPHLADSELVDQLVWKDCVEYRFRTGGLTRAKALELPWPLLVERIQTAAARVVTSLENHDALHTLERSVMNVPLLQASAAGKTVKKALKVHKLQAGTELYQRLQSLLDKWKTLAADSGVAVHDVAQSPSSCQSSEEQQDLITAESCHSWRQLFAILQQREETRRSNQGKRMREIRKNLASGRPKVVKVRPTSSKHTRILARAEERRSTQPVAGNSKLSKIRHEAAVVAARQKLSPAKLTKPSSSFGAAVAFATAPGRNSNNVSRSKANKVVLAGGRTMTIPVKKTATKGPPWKAGRH